MYRVTIDKDGERLSAFDVSRSQVAGLYALAIEIEKFLEHGYKIIFDPIRACRYILANDLETIAIELIQVPTVEPRMSSLDLRNAALAVIGVDGRTPSPDDDPSLADTQPIVIAAVSQ